MAERRPLFKVCARNGAAQAASVSKSAVGWSGGHEAASTWEVLEAMRMEGDL